MHLVAQRNLGIAAAVLLAFLVMVKRVVTSSVLEKPTGPLLVQSVNIFH